MLSNATVAVLIENINGPTRKDQSLLDIDYALRLKQEAYFKFILWTTFGLSFVRFAGVSVTLSRVRPRTDRSL